jgi:hypothetical protein
VGGSTGRFHSLGNGKIRTEEMQSLKSNRHMHLSDLGQVT